MGATQVKVRINGVEHSATVDNRMLLCDFIRDVAGLTATHIGCLTGNCGACTVIMDGLTVKSCTLLAVQADGSEITTLEGLSNGLTLNPIQELFHKNYAVQCGYCTPGILVTVHYLLSKKTPMSVDDIRDKLSGNLCRCTGYVNIVKSVAELLKRE